MSRPSIPVSSFALGRIAGPPILLLHGFPQTHLMWRGVAPLLARNFTVVMCRSSRLWTKAVDRPPPPIMHPMPSAPWRRHGVGDAAPGFPRFCVAGHDRGGRVAYRMALDHPEASSGCAVLDILPVETAWQRADAQVRAWLLAMVAAGAARAASDAFCRCGRSRDRQCAGRMGIASTAFRRGPRGLCRALRDPGHAHAICEEYRAAASIDRAHDAADRDAGHKIGCPLCVVERAGTARHLVRAEGPLAIWRDWADDVRGRAIEGGHFFPEETPEPTAAALGRFFGAESSGS